MNFRTLLLLSLSVLAFVATVSAQTKSIAFCSKELGGLQDQAYVTMLTNAGYNVHAVNQYWANIDSADVVALDTFDLVIITKGTTSGDFGDNPQEIAYWMSVTTPVMIMSDFVARNSRLNLFNTNNVTANGGLKLDAVLPNHPVFSNIALVGDSTNNISTTPLEIVMSTTAGNGTVIATDALTGNVAIAEWPANTPFYAGAVDSAAGVRMYFSTDYGYKLSADGDQLLLNTIEHLTTPENTSAVVPNRLIWVGADTVSDALYLAEIRDLGFDVVTASLPASVINANPTLIMDSLMTAEVIVVSRNTNSADYANKAFWNSVPTPIITISAFLARNNRWGFSSNVSTVVSADGLEVKVVGDTNSVLFDYITVTDSQLTLLTSRSIEYCEFDPALGAGNGTLYALSPTLNRIAIAEWPANTPFFAGSPDSAAGPRLMLPLPGTNVLNLDGKQLLSNALKKLTSRPTAPVVLTRNYAPYDLALSADAIAETEPVGSFVAVISTMDLNAGDSHTYSLGGVDSASFSISSDSLFSAVAFDFATVASYAISITATDTASTTFTKAFTINIIQDTTSAVDPFQLTGVEVYPNPFSNQIYVRGVTSEKVRVELFDLTGRRVFQETYAGASAILVELPVLPHGVYSARVTADNRTKSVLLIRE